MMSMEVEEIVAQRQKIVNILKEAHRTILEIYEDKDCWDVVEKVDDRGFRSPLTRADQVANEIICKGLLAMTPDIPVISEENKEISSEERSTWTRCWVVDPIDGTKEFIKRTGEFTTNVALVIEGVSVFGAVGIPTKSEIYVGDALLNKAWRYSENGDPIELVQRTVPVKINSVVVSKASANDLTWKYIHQFNKEPNCVTAGSSLKFLMVALGEADLYPRLAPTSEWDTAAANAICSALGCEVIGLIYNEDEDPLFEEIGPLVYNKKCLLNPSFVVRVK